MNRNDERKMVDRPPGRMGNRAKLDDSMADEDEMDTGKGSGIAGVASTPGAARRDEMPISREKVHREAGRKMDHTEDEGEIDSLASSPAGTRRGEAEHMRRAHEEELGERGTVRGGREIMHEQVEADHVIGDGGKVGVKSAEGYADMASAKANRKEADEPEREMNEQAAMGGRMGKEPSVPHKHTMSHGERETVAKHTI